jgi:hypothetical protein
MHVSFHRVDTKYIVGVATRVRMIYRTNPGFIDVHVSDLAGFFTSNVKCEPIICCNEINASCKQAVVLQRFPDRMKIA